MALLALSKCRLCMKLGDFYSIFAEDNSVQLSRMAMACSDIQVYEGDGLPDKVCGECVEKLSAAYIFKQQCERSDTELRKSLNIPVNPPNDNATNNGEKTKTLPQRSTRNKRKYNDIENAKDDGLLEERYSVYVPNSLFLENVSSASKRSRLTESSNVHASNTFDCKFCSRKFTSVRGLYGHSRVHNNENYDSNDTVSQPYPEDDTVFNKDGNDEYGEDDQLNCEHCGQQFANRALFDEHSEKCNTSQYDEKYVLQCFSRLICPVCKGKYKKKVYLRKHITRSGCGTKLRQSADNNESQQTIFKYDNALSRDNNDTPPPKKNVQCSNCKSKFWSHVSMLRHFLKCVRDNGANRICCLTCNMNFSSKNCFYKHVRRVHVFGDSMIARKKSNGNMLECHKCSKTFEDQSQLVIHLAAHMANINNESGNAESKKPYQIYKCVKCFKKFRYRAFLMNHIRKFHSNLSLEACEGVDPLKRNQCDLCGKNFKYAKSLVWHKNTKHPMIDDSLIQNKQGLEFSTCPAKCLHCDIMFDNEHETKAHNKMHIENNVKVKNEYTCPECSLKFTNTKIFRLHIKEHNISNFDNDDDDNEIYDASISNYCEVTSSALRESDTEIDIKPSIDILDNIKPIIEPDGVSCSICSKKLDSIRGYHLHMRKHKKRGAKLPTFLTCFVCQERFANKNAHQQHMRVHYNDNNIDPSLLICSICRRPSKNMRSYIAHLTWHTENGKYKCHLCDDKFPYHKQYKNHMSTKHNININELSENTNFQCHICVKYFEDDVSLQYHILCHQKGEPVKEERFECFDCNEQFSSKYQHIIHMQSYHHIRPAWENHGISKIIPKKHRSKLGIPIKKHSVDIKKNLRNIYDTSKVVCAVCDASFSSRILLNKHLKKVHPVSKMVKKNDPDAKLPVEYLCVLCGKKFPSDERLQMHMTSHKQRPKPYKCTICDKRSLSLQYHLYHLKCHLYKNESNSPFECGHCELKFSRRQDMRAHLAQVHDIVENYVIKVEEEPDDSKIIKLQEHQCNICKKVLTSENYFKKHMSWHNSRQCNYCLLYFENKSFLTAHIKYNCDKKKLIGNTDQFDKKLKCQKCNKQFSIAVKLHCHMMVQHKIEPENKDVTQSSVCDFCFSVFPSEERALSHRKVHFHSAAMKCKICSKSFRVLSYFKSHKTKHYRQSFAENPLKCDHCQEQFTSLANYIEHLKVAHQQQMIWLVPDVVQSEKCTICDKEFLHMERHMMYHEKYKCKKCNQYFFSEDLYNKHICEVESENETDNQLASPKSETVETPVKEEPEEYSECDYCFKPISSFYTKAKHESNHSKVVYFCCRLCDRKFFMKSAFNVHSTAHRLQHFNKNPLRCRHCGESFTRYQHYTDHIRQVHDDPETMEFHLKPNLPKECLICKKTFINLHRHYKYHMSFRCRNCSKYILSQKLYNNHNCNDTTEDPKLVVEYDGDISALVELDATEWENERLLEAIPRNQDFIFTNDSDYKNNTFFNSDENLNESTESRNSSQDDDASVSAPTEYSTKINSFNNVTFDNFSPVISSTVSLSSTVNEDKVDDMVNIQVKSEPIDHYYKEYGHYDFQNSLMDIDNPSG